VRSAHDCADGGLAVALAECCLWSGLGLTVDAILPSDAESDPLALAALLFGEAPSRIVVSLTAEQWDALATLAVRAGVPLTRLGVVGGDTFALGSAFSVPVERLYATWRSGLSAALSAAQARGVPDGAPTDG
ncbi:MAG TPA: AIR synthase-related protein, partial [Ktedonobacterales bacterium]|nr:AIR synthase-related protein [Ktedonobacterales bacterium]